jgi:hypothetical protein
MRDLRRSSQPVLLRVCRGRVLWCLRGRISLRQQRCFANNGGEAATFQSFLHRREDFAVFPRLAVNDSVGMKADPRNQCGTLFFAPRP